MSDPNEGRLVEKLEKWVAEHPDAADAPTIDITTQKEFTIREVLNQLIQERDTGAAIVDEDILKIKRQIAKWLGE